LYSVLAYEQGHWLDATSRGYNRVTLVRAYLDAITWAAAWGRSLAQT
jgi:hypothetical protein